MRSHSLSWNRIAMVIHYALVDGARRHTAIILCLCVCLCRKPSAAHSLCLLKIKRWNVQCKLITQQLLYWNKIGGFWRELVKPGTENGETGNGKLQKWETKMENGRICIRFKGHNSCVYHATPTVASHWLMRWDLSPKYRPILKGLNYIAQNTVTGIVSVFEFVYNHKEQS